MSNNICYTTALSLKFKRKINKFKEIQTILFFPKLDIHQHLKQFIKMSLDELKIAAAKKFYKLWDKNLEYQPLAEMLYKREPLIHGVQIEHVFFSKMLNFEGPGLPVNDIFTPRKEVVMKVNASGFMAYLNDSFKLVKNPEDYIEIKLSVSKNIKFQIKELVNMRYADFILRIVHVFHSNQYGFDVCFDKVKIILDRFMSTLAERRLFKNDLSDLRKPLVLTALDTLPKQFTCPLRVAWENRDILDSFYYNMSGMDMSGAYNDPWNSMVDFKFIDRYAIYLIEQAMQRFDYHDHCHIKDLVYYRNL